MDVRQALLVLIEEQRRIIAELKARVAELEEELRRRGKNYRPKGNAAKRKRKGPDRRSREHRQHPGCNRPEFQGGEQAILHDVHVEHCPFCGGGGDAAGQFDDVFVEDIPEPKVEIHHGNRI